MFKKRRDYSYYSSYSYGHKSRLRVGRVAIVAVVAVVLVVGLVAVSYTHLDVYKRQNMHRMEL